MLRLVIPVLLALDLFGIRISGVMVIAEWWVVNVFRLLR